MHETSRRGFIAAGSVSLAGGVAFAGGLVQKQSEQDRTDSRVRADAERVRAFVGACHARIETVREMTSRSPRGIGDSVTTKPRSARARTRVGRTSSSCC